MKGNNELNLNEATMIEVVQYWLNAQMHAGKAPEVYRVQPDRSGSFNCFIIYVREPEAIA